MYFALGKYALLREYHNLQTAIHRATDGAEPITTRGCPREMPLLQRVMRESPHIRSILLSSWRHEERDLENPPRSAQVASWRGVTGNPVSLAPVHELPSSQRSIVKPRKITVKGAPTARHT